MKRILYALAGLSVGYILSDFIKGDGGDRVLYKSDTISIVRIDTISIKEPVPVYKEIVDTIYIHVEDSVARLPVEQYHYRENRLYDIWLSGYRPRLDSIRIYNTTSEKTITNNIYVRKRAWSLSPYLGINVSKGLCAPAIGISLMAPNRWSFGIEAGMYSQNNTYYGLRIGKNILAN